MKKAKQAIPNQKLIYERIRHEWSQQEIADRIGTTPVNVSRWERGATTPSPYFRQRLATLFDKSIEELGLLPQESPSSEDETPENEVTKPFEQAESQSSLITNEQGQDTASSVPNQEAGLVFSYIDQGERVPASKPFAFLRSPRHSFAARVIMLTSLVLLVVMAGLLWFNITHSPLPDQGKGSASSASVIGEAVPAFYHVVGKSQLLIDDPLNNDLTQGGWNIAKAPDSTGCYIANGAYDIKENDNEYCLANNFSSITDFVFQTTVTLVRGPHAGIVFRVNDNHTFYYYFGIDVHGNYRLYYSTPATPDALNPSIVSGYSPALHKGYNQPNQLGVKAIGANISLYINSQFVTSVHDSTYTSGNLGVRVVVNDGYSKGQGDTEATYRNAKVWLL